MKFNLDCCCCWLLLCVFVSAAVTVLGVILGIALATHEISYYVSGRGESKVRAGACAVVDWNPVGEEPYVRRMAVTTAAVLAVMTSRSACLHRHCFCASSAQVIADVPAHECLPAMMPFSDTTGGCPYHFRLLLHLRCR